MIVALSILLVLSAILLPAIQMVRGTSAQLDDKNKMKQMGLALHSYASAMDNRLPGTEEPSIVVIQPYPWPSAVRIGTSCNSPHFNILPFLGSELSSPYGNWVRNSFFYYSTTKIYLSGSDPSIDFTIRGSSFKINSGFGATSFPANANVFKGKPSLSTSIPDGLSTTAWLSQRYFHCEERLNSTTHHYVVPTMEFTGSRSCTFADSEWQDVVPIPDTGGPGRTLPSTRGVTFQQRPTVLAADGRQLQSFHKSGLLMGMLDGSVRTVAPGVDPATFWALITPNGGEISE